MFNRARQLRDAGVIGINERNCQFIMPNNPRRLYRFVDDKGLTKELAVKAGINVPELYGLISTVNDSHRITEIIDDKTDFVIKPAHGSGGKGILVIENRRKNIFIKPDDSMLPLEALIHHTENILGGIYSLGGQQDQAIVEYRVRFDPVFKHISYQGVPDIRVLLYRGIPAMTMLRLPTRQSDGKANLHQGAVGVGIDLQSGLTTLAVCNDRRIEEHPDFGSSLADLQIPNWEEILLLSAKCYDLAPLGYLGVDLVLDAELGPLVLELNARPGLAIQIANGRGLKHRFDAYDSLQVDSLSPDERIEVMHRVMEKEKNG